MFDLEHGKSAAARATEVGARLRALRLHRNITQASLAERAGVSRPTLAALERDGRGSLETVAAVMYALGREGELDGLFVPDPPSTLAAVTAPRQRQRAR
jgi:putative transcriptional regulator